MNQLLHVDTNFPPEDYEWLKREAAKRNLRIMDIINELMEIYYPHGFTTDRPMSQEEFSKHLEGLTLTMVRKARCQIQ